MGEKSLQDEVDELAPPQRSEEEIVEILRASGVRGSPRVCSQCIVAKYLSMKTGKNIGVGPLSSGWRAWITTSSMFGGAILPGTLVNVIHKFDDGFLGELQESLT